MRYNIDFQRYDSEHNKINKSTKTFTWKAAQSNRNSENK